MRRDNVMRRALVLERSGGACEANVQVRVGGGTIYTRCFKTATDVHHMLTRSRGGLILDEFGEIEHLIHLCRQCHTLAHSPSGR